jgi:histidine triad (HIT) family protein
MSDCVFCKIVEGEIPSQKVYEDEEVLAFHDIQPAAPIHILVIPKKHIASLNEVGKDDQALLGKIHTVIQTIAKEQGFSDNGFRVIINCGKDGGQEVAHLHFHVLAGKQLGEKIV